MKRKRLDLDRLEKDSLLKKALPTNSCKVNGNIPLDGYQYLAMVQQEAKSIPDILVANLEVEDHSERIHDARNIVQYSCIQSCTLSGSWFDQFIQKFQRLKRSFMKIPRKEATCLKQFRNESSWNKALYIDQLLEPTITILLQINHTLALKLVKFHCNWIQRDFSTLKCQWLFCLLLIIDPLLTSEQVNILRNLARNLLDIKDTKNNSETAGIQILLSIISGIFGQKDIVQT